MHKTESFIFEHNGIRLHGLKSGSGENVLLLFHGFGQNPSVFSSYTEVFEDYTLYSFSLFYHGESYWPHQEKPLNPECWTELISAWLQSENIERFSLLGFSIGAKPILALMEKHSFRIDHLILIAPDGIRKNFWYNLATCTWLGNFFFKGITKNLFLLKKIIAFGITLKLLPKSFSKLLAAGKTSDQIGLQIYNTWMVYRELKIHEDSLFRHLQKENCRINLFAGNQDRMFPPQKFKHFIEKIPNAEMIVLEAGHNNLIREVCRFYRQKGYIA